MPWFLTHELESELQLFFGLILRTLVVSHEINLELPLTYAGIFLIVMAMLYCVRNPFTRCISTIKKRPIEWPPLHTTSEISCTQEITTTFTYSSICPTSSASKGDRNFSSRPPPTNPQPILNIVVVLLQTNPALWRHTQPNPSNGVARVYAFED